MGLGVPVVGSLVWEPEGTFLATLGVAGFMLGMGIGGLVALMLAALALPTLLLAVGLIEEHVGGQALAATLLVVNSMPNSIRSAAAPSAEN